MISNIIIVNKRITVIRNYSMFSTMCFNERKQQTCDFNLIQEFRREGSDLHMVQRIGLVEALCGFQITITHLDGRQLLVKYPPGKVIEPGNDVSIQHLLNFFFLNHFHNSPVFCVFHCVYFSNKQDYCS